MLEFPASTGEGGTIVCAVDVADADADADADAAVVLRLKTGVGVGAEVERVAVVDAARE